MNIECPHCKALIHVDAQHFPKMYELECTSCNEITVLKNDLERTVSLQFILTEPETIKQEYSGDENVESFHQEEKPMRPFCFWQQQKGLYEEQHAGVQQE